MRQWIEICRESEIPALGSRRVKRAAGLEVAIFKNAENEVFALLDYCPHKGGPLSQGIVFGKSVACPLHNWSIELDSGQALAPDVGCTQPFSVKSEAGFIYLDQEELKNLALTQSRPLAGPKLTRGST